VQVKGFMPPKDGLSRKTPTGRADGKNVVWHNFSCCSDICYALAYICKFRYIAKKGDAPQTIVAAEHLPLCAFV